MAKKSDYQIQLKIQKHEKFKELRGKLPTYVHHYLDDMIIDYQINTLIAYARDLTTFFEFLLENNPLCRDKEIKDVPLSVLEGLTYQDITEYRNYLATNYGLYKHDNQASSIERRMAPLRGLFADLCNGNVIKNNPTAIQNAHRKKKKDRKEIVYLEGNEVEQLLRCVDSSLVSSERQQKFCKKTHLRDKAILTLLLNTGIRISECVGLDLDDVDFKENSIKIVRKGGFEATLYFNETTHNALKEYIELERPQYEDSGSGAALFLSMQKKRMAIRSIQNMVKKFAKETVPNKNISAHKMRSSYGTALYEQTGDIRLVADILGHQDVTTTAKHYSAMKKQHMQKAGKINPYSK